MSNLAKLDFVALDITGKNYLQWVLDAEIHMAANGLANAIKYDHKDKGPDHASSRGRGHGYRGERGNNFGNYRGGRGGQFKRSYSHQKWEQNNGPRDKDKMNADNFCNRCGCKGHWSRTCRTGKHFVDLYQQSLKDKCEKKIEANFTVENDKVETNFADEKDNYGGFLDVSDFFSDPDRRIDHLIGDGSVQK
ncbi:hypothetical protein RND81_12G036000 [Saponaria officinalis]|uniref:CCHC-type domain-containing protein n=1 Tax=Saponaria officinalis TaxID=3572 RepID=A0AAW1H4L4_SAPOF